MTTPCASTGPEVRPRRVRRGLAVVTIGLVALGIGPVLADPGSARPMCDVDDPPPICDGPGTTEPEPDPPKPPTWSSSVLLQQTSERSVDAPTAIEGWSPSGHKLSGAPVSWTDPTRVSGTFSIPTSGGTHTAYRLQEPTQPGPLCRIPATPGVPSGTSPIRVLTAPRSTVSAADLATSAGSLVGKTITTSDASVTVASAKLTPLDGRLQLQLTGKLVSGWVYADFTYAVPLFIGATTSPTDSRVVSVAAGQGALSLNATDIGSAFLLLFAGDQEPKFRAAVQKQAQTTFDQTLAKDKSVAWFAGQGYRTSARQLGISPSGIWIDAAFCRLG